MGHIYIYILSAECGPYIYIYILSAECGPVLLVGDVTVRYMLGRLGNNG